MLYLVISVLCSLAVSVLLKLARTNHIDIRQAIGVNYLAAVGVTAYFFPPNVAAWSVYLPKAWLIGLLGILLPSVFVLMGRAVAQAGMVKSDAAQRLSLFLPIVAALTLFGEQLTEGRAVGLALAFTALVCLLWKSDDALVRGKGKKQKAAGTPWQQAGLLLGVWAGYGVIDILFKQLAKSGGSFGSQLLLVFALSGVLMFGYLFYQGGKWRVANVLAGVLLGLLNFANIFFYIKAHQAFSANPTVVFAGMNMGVITGGTLIGAWLFKEKISAVNWAGVAVALCALVCLFYWPLLKAWAGMA